ncbi:hypothetical protein HOB85_01155 [Candidatus Woesearchaeota archaeon]|nr:hypothetical protein [Candidatus Woesearchaeota archaeon]
MTEKKEVQKMMHYETYPNKAIEDLFYNQIRALSTGIKNTNTFDLQFSDRWLK